MRNSVIQFLYATVCKSPGKIALIDKEDSLTFTELFVKAYEISKLLTTNTTCNQPILVYLPKCCAAIVSFAGILLSGNFYVPVDVSSPRKRLAAIIGNIKPRSIISTNDFRDHFNELDLDEDGIIFYDDLAFESRGTNIQEIISESRKVTDKIIDSDPCYAMSTSGSTGIPKQVVIAHRGVADYIEWAVTCLQVGTGDSIGNQAPLFFDNSTLDIYLSWTTGATLHLIPQEYFIFPVRLVDYLEENAISFIFFVPSVLVNISRLNILSRGRLPKLEKIIFAGEVMPTKHLAYWQKHLPGRLYANLYGPTEITVDCTYFIVDRIYEPHETLPIGYPCINSGVLILNDDDQLAVENERGELCVRGSSLALGYWNDAENTKKVFVQNPIQPYYFDRIYRTGDLVYRNEHGQIIFVGRKDSQIKHMGHRIELGEIDCASMSLPGVSKCCTLYNEIKKEITLFYAADAEVPVSRFREALSQILPSYMIPRRFVFMTNLPLTSNGKIDRQSLVHEFF